MRQLAGLVATCVVATAPAFAQEAREAPGSVTEARPTARFRGEPTTGLAPLVVRFEDRSLADATTWLWDFGDGATSTKYDPRHRYEEAGSYTVTLTITGPGWTDTRTRTDYITVLPAIQAAFVASPTVGQAPLRVEFTDTSIGIVTSRLWSFGDGQTSTEEHPVHVYDQAGTPVPSRTTVAPKSPSNATAG